MMTNEQLILDELNRYYAGLSEHSNPVYGFLPRGAYHYLQTLNVCQKQQKTTSSAALNDPEREIAQLQAAQQKASAESQEITGKIERIESLIAEGGRKLRQANAELVEMGAKFDQRTSRQHQETLHKILANCDTEAKLQTNIEKFQKKIAEIDASLENHQAILAKPFQKVNKEEQTDIYRKIAAERDSLVNSKAVYEYLKKGLEVQQLVFKTYAEQERYQQDISGLRQRQTELAAQIAEQSARISTLEATPRPQEPAARAEAAIEQQLQLLASLYSTAEGRRSLLCQSLRAFDFFEWVEQQDRLKAIVQIYQNAASNQELSEADRASLITLTLYDSLRNSLRLNLQKYLADNNCLRWFRYKTTGKARNEARAQQIDYLIQGERAIRDQQGLSAEEKYNLLLGLIQRVESMAQASHHGRILKSGLQQACRQTLRGETLAIAQCPNLEEKLNQIISPSIHQLPATTRQWRQVYRPKEEIFRTFDLLQLKAQQVSHKDAGGAGPRARVSPFQ